MNIASTRAMAAAVATVLLAGAVAACNPQAGGSEAAERPADAICPTAETAGTIKIGMSSPLAVFAPLLLALETDAFKGTGIDVQIEPISSADSLPLVARGELDAQMTSLSYAHFNTLNSGVEVKWIAPMEHQKKIPQGTPVPGFWSRTDVVGPATNPNISALKGATVSTPTGGSGVSGLILNNALAGSGLSVNDVKFTSLRGPDALVALKNGAVDAAWISAPLEVEAAKDPNLVPVAGYEPGVTGTSLMAGPSLLERPELAVKFLQVLQKTVERYLTGDYREDPKTVSLLAAAEETDKATVRASALVRFDPEFDMSGTKKFARKLQQFGLEQGELEYDEPLDVSKLIDKRFTNALSICDNVVA